MAEAITMKLALVPDRGVIRQLEIGYSELEAHVDDKVGFIIQRIQSEYAELRPNCRDVREQLGVIVAAFHPPMTRASFFGLNVPGDIAPQPAHGSTPPATASPNAAKELADLQQQLGTAFKKQQEAEQRWRQQRDRASLLEAERDQLDEQRQEAEDRASRLQTECQNLTDSVTALRTQNAQLQQQIGGAIPNIELLNRRVNDLTTENAQLTAQLNTARSNARSLEQQVENLTAKVEELKQAAWASATSEPRKPDRGGLPPGLGVD